MNRLAAAHALHAKSPFAPLSLTPASFNPAAPLDHPADAQSLTSHLPASSGSSARPIHRAAPGVALFAPVHYERRYAYPLIVWLHGAGSSERELRQLMPNVSVRNYVGVAARGVPMEGEGARGYTWSQEPEAVDAAVESVSQCIEQAERRYHIHPDRIFLAGHGAGGTMALRIAMQFSLPLAGAVSLGGPLPRGNCPLARLNQLRQLPLMLMCCRDSASYPSRQVADDLRLLHSAGCRLAIREYLCGDELYTDMFSDLDSWLMERVCQGASAAMIS
ncbi:MAG TPA: alpha/beta fold hydrolase [Lacipirellulaceae bacterium]|nr:alpha/beta fold hydrolase [Lacipirellulaceae bacterium]